MMIGLAMLMMVQTDGDASRIVQRMVDCRQITDDAQRLACYDREAPTVARAQETREIVVLDRAEAAAREPVRPDIDQLASTLVSAGQAPSGRWILRLEDGSRWEQIDTRRVIREPRAGDAVEISRGALGSYFASVADGIGIRVRPIRN